MTITLMEDVWLANFAGTSPRCVFRAEREFILTIAGDSPALAPRGVLYNYNGGSTFQVACGTEHLTIAASVSSPGTYLPSNTSIFPSTSVFSPSTSVSKGTAISPSPAASTTTANSSEFSKTALALVIILPILATICFIACILLVLKTIQEYNRARYPERYWSAAAAPASAAKADTTAKWAAVATVFIALFGGGTMVATIILEIRKHT